MPLNNGYNNGTSRPSHARYGENQNNFEQDTSSFEHQDGASNAAQNQAFIPYGPNKTASYSAPASYGAHNASNGSDFFSDSYTPSANYGEGSDYAGFASGAHANDDGLIRVRKKRRRGMKIALIVFAVLLAVIVGCAVALMLWVNSLNASMGIEDEGERAQLMEALQPTEQAESGAFYMLILGSDAREADETSRSDVTMLVRVDPGTGVVDLVSIPRDTMVTIEGHGTQKINAAYAFGGAAGAVNTVSEFAGVPIAHYAEVHFQELEQVVDMLGGIWVNVPESFSAGNGGMTFQQGEQLLNGQQALAFARERYNVSGGDFGRAQAQRIIVQAIIERVLASQPAELPGVIGSLAGCVSTDLSVGDLVGLAQQFQGGGLTMYSAACPSYSFTQDGVSYACTMFDEWRDMMCRVDAGLDPNDTSAAIPKEQASNLKLGAATNSPAPRSYEALAENAGLTTNDVAPQQ